MTQQFAICLHFKFYMFFLCWQLCNYTAACLNQDSLEKETCFGLNKVKTTVKHVKQCFIVSATGTTDASK